MEITYQLERWGVILEELMPLSQIQGIELGRGYGLDLDYVKYASLDQQELLKVTTVRDRGTLVGWYINILIMHPHYKTVLFGFMDTFYIVPQYRVGMIGLGLFIEMEKHMRQLGVKELIAISKYACDVSQIFNRLNWTPEGITYSKALI